MFIYFHTFERQEILVKICGNTNLTAVVALATNTVQN